MMISTPSAPGGAAAADTTLPGTAIGAATTSPATGAPEGVAANTGLSPLFAQLLGFASLAVPAEIAGTATEATALTDDVAGETTEEVPAEMRAENQAEMPLAAMMPPLHFAMLPPAPTQPTMTPTAQAPAAGVAADQARGATLLAVASDGARQAAADAITARGGMAASPLMARLLQGSLPAGGDPSAPRAGAETRQPTAAASAVTAAPSAATAAAVLAAQDSAAPSGQEGQTQQQPGEGQAGFRGVMAATAPVTGAAAPADTVKLAGAPEDWQQPLRAALGDRLQLNLQKGNDQAVIRLEPPNLGTIEISIRQSAGALHVSMSATHGEVVRQLNAVGDSMRQDLSQRQYGDVAVTVSQSSRSMADSEGRGRQAERDAEQQRQERGPGRALSEGEQANTTFAMLRE